MFSFLKNWFQKDQDQLRPLEELKKDLQEDLGDVSGPMETILEAVKRDRVITELSLHPDWESQLDAEKKYTLRYLQEELPPMFPDTIGVAGFSLVPEDHGVTVALFFRNATERVVRFENVTLSIYLDEKMFAKCRFDVSATGPIPPGTSRPWEVFFPEESFAGENMLFTRWKVKMDFGPRTHVWPKHLDLDPQMEERMTEKQKERLFQIVNRLPSLQPNEIEANSYDIGRTAKGDIVVAVLFRNATMQVYAPPKLKATLRDEANEVIASGTLDTTNLKVRAGTSQPWMFVFPKNILKKPNAKLSGYHLEVKEV